MENDRALQELIIDYVDNIEDDDITEDLKEWNISENEDKMMSFLVLIGKISSYHSHNNNPERFVGRLCKLIDPYIECINTYLNVEGEYIKTRLKEVEEKNAYIMSKTMEMMDDYSYERQHFTSAEWRYNSFCSPGSKYFHRVEKAVNGKDFDKIIKLLDKFEDILIEVIENEYEEEEEYANHQSITFDSMHNHIRYISEYWNKDNLAYLDIKSKLNYVSLYSIFKHNKRMLKYFLDKDMLIDSVTFDYVIYKNEIEEIIDYDDVERFVSYVTVTNYDIDGKIKYYITERHNKVTIPELCVIKGAYRIFKYLVETAKVNIEDPLILYELSPFGGNPEIIHYIEDNMHGIQYTDVLFRNIMKSYNFELLRYVNNVYPKELLHSVVVECNEMQKHLFERCGMIFFDHCEKHLDEIFLDRYRKRSTNLLYEVDRLLNHKFSYALATKHHEHLLLKFLHPEITHNVVFTISQTDSQYKMNMFNMESEYGPRTFPGLSQQQLLFVVCAESMLWYLYKYHYYLMWEIIEEEVGYKALRAILQIPGEHVLTKYITEKFERECMDFAKGDLAGMLYNERLQ